MKYPVLSLEVLKVVICISHEVNTSTSLHTHKDNNRKMAGHARHDVIAGGDGGSSLLDVTVGGEGGSI
jgi:hypothetical protein